MVPSVGFLHYGSFASNADVVTAFCEGLRETGCVDGESIAVRFRWAEGDDEKLRKFATDLVRDHVAVTFASDSYAVDALRDTGSTIPVVFVSGDSPTIWGLESELSRSARRLTGVTVRLAAKWLELLHKLLPRARMVGMLVHSDNPDCEIQMTDLQLAALRINMIMNVRTAKSEEDISTMISEFAERGFDALFVPSDKYFLSRRDLFVALAARHAMPAIYYDREYPVAGGLMSCSPDMAEAYRQAGIYCGRIVRGEKPAKLPVVQADTFKLVLNAKTSETLGLTPPPSILLHADEVIE